MRHDKRLHFAAGIAIGMTVIVIPWYGALLLVAAAGAGKELYDMTGRGTPEWDDLWWTLGGGCLSVGLIQFVRYI